MQVTVLLEEDNGHNAILLQHTFPGTIESLSDASQKVPKYILEYDGKHYVYAWLNGKTFVFRQKEVLCVLTSTPKS